MENSKGHTYLDVLIIALITVLSCCERGDDNISQLKGTWVEVTNHSDSIDFDRWETEDIFILRRGYELKNGEWQPIFGSGIYSYKCSKDSIKINNMLWSCMCYPSYYFKMNSTSTAFEIGNFYDTSMVQNKRITFYRIQ